MDTLYEDSETGCYPRFNPEPWDKKEIIWKDESFLKDHVRTFLRVPLGLGKMMTKNIEKIQNADALPPLPPMLSDESSMWGSVEHRIGILLP